MSRKSERLINLTIALLATNRYLTKSEIFKTVAGYEGEAEARDRMFERDKDDLRTIGIDIELGSFDPLFDDEAGYCIKRSSYSTQIENLTAEELLLLAHAAQSWREAALAPESTAALRKLKSLGLDSDSQEFSDSLTPAVSAPEQLPEIIEAINQLHAITFEYRDTDNVAHTRKVEPYRLSHTRGLWYLTAFDCMKREVRTFRVDRIASSVIASSKSGSFEINQDLLINHLQPHIPVNQARIALRKGRGNSLRAQAHTTDQDEEWDVISLDYLDEDSLIEQVLWLGLDAEVLAPDSLVASVIDRLRSVVTRNG